MRDPLTWAFPIFRAFGIPVKVHAFLIIFAVGTFFRQVLAPGGSERVFEVFLLTGPVLFGLILLHEFGHCFAGRLMDGEAKEIVMWPLGGLATVDVPQHWRAHTITALGGPLVNVAVCFAAFVVLAGFGFLPTLNPLADPYAAEMRNYRDGRIHTSEFGLRLYQPGTDEAVKPTEDMVSKIHNQFELQEAINKTPYARPIAPRGLVWVDRVFWVSWVLLLINLLPGYPLDGGQILQGLVWARSDRDQAIQTASYAGIVVAAVFLIASLTLNEVWPMAVGLFVALACWLRMNPQFLADGDGEYGGGYGGSLNDDDEPAPRPAKKRQSFLKRLTTARNARRMQRENAQQRRDEDRLDALLEKIARKEALTAEETAFMKRVSTRYKNR